MIALYKLTFAYLLSAVKGKGSSIVTGFGADPILHCSTGDINHKPSSRLPLLSARPAVSFPAVDNDRR